MSIVPLTSVQHPLQFTDSANCKRWIEQLTLEGKPAGLNRLLAPVERLKILEVLREPVHFVQGESSKRYAGRPLPLDDGESAIWNNVLSLWREMSRNYQQCLKAYREGDLAIAPHAALIGIPEANIPRAFVQAQRERAR